MQRQFHAHRRSALALALWSLAAACSNSAPGPPIVIISVDTLRADFLGCYGYARDTSPALDRFAADSLLFENAMSHASSTWPSLASLMSGFLPHETQTMGGFEEGLIADVETLAELLQRDGYRTLAVVGNWGLVKERGWAQGFDVFDDVLLERELVRGIPERVAVATTDRAIELLDRQRDDAFFLWVHYQDPHGPYTPPEPHASRFPAAPLDGGEALILDVNESVSGYGGIPSYQVLGEHRSFDHYRARYEGEIRYMDAQLGRFLSALRRRGLYDEAFIAFTADHGETMGEHDNFFSHGQSLDHPLVHIPLILRHGDALRGRRADFVQHLDLAPTLLAVAGIPQDPRMRGSDLRSATPLRTIVAEREAAGTGALDASIVRDEMRLVCRQAPDGEHCALYDLAVDPRGERDLAREPEHRPSLLALREELRAVMAEDRLGIRAPRAPEPPSELEREALRRLGYLE